MAYRKWDKWSTKLPAVWTFLGENKIEKEDKSSDKAWYVVAASSDEDKLELSGEFKGLEAELMTALTDMDWTDSQGAASVVVAGVKFLVVSVSKLEVMERVSLANLVLMSQQQWVRRKASMSL